MNIPQGYKQTELGIIPEDWEVKRISDFTSIITGGTPSTQRPEYWGGSIMWMSSGELNKKFVFDVKGRITTEGLLNSSTRIIPPFCVLIGLAGQGKTRGTAAYNYISLCTNQSIAAILPNDKYNSLYLYYVVDSKYEYLRLLSSGDGGRGGLNKNLLNSLEISFPKTIAEQQAIAEALSDIDGLIAAVDKKIAKKRLIKQGAMQQLLTGKKRLPGFSDPWVEKKLGEIGYTYSGLTGKSKDDFGQGNAKYITFLNVLANPILKENLFGSITIRENEQQNKVQFGDLFFNTSSETPEDVGTCAVLLSYHEELYLNSFCFGYRLTDDNVLGLYLAYYFRSRLGRQLMTSLAQGATRYNLSKELFNASRIILPETKDEQIAIATMLNDMDKEIDDLEAQRDKYRLLKSGMMQKLLTGQIRLTKPLTNVVPLVPGDSAVREIPVDAHIWAGHIVNRLWQSKGWGRTKLQKSLHLVGCYAQLDLGEEYIRNTAGPDDQRLMNYIDRKFKQYRHVNIEKERLLDGKIHYTYTPTSRIQEVEMAYERYPQDIRERVDNLLDKLNLMNLAEAEILSTLYAVWNNRIIKGERITDDLLVSDFYAWSEHKADFEERKVRRMLDYMCKENIVPIGWGKYIDEK